MTTSPILVIGATGKVGRRVLANLAAQGHAARPAGRRTPLPFDWQDRSNWAAHFAGIDTAFVAYYPDLASPQGAEDIAALVAVAKAAGLKRMVLLSGRGESGAVRAENVLRDSGLGYTVVRAAFFNQNFSEGMMYPGVMQGILALPAGQRVEPFVDVDDIAEIAASALVDDRHHNRLYEVTGPRLISFADAVAEIGAATGRSVQYAPISLDDFHAAMAGEVGPEDAELYTELFRELFDGRNESVTDGVQQALGRPPRDFADFCRTVARSGAWHQAA
ncbi:NmrA family NAD(P)-binding protein [Devosia sediminis]|uniref:NmrA family NAD(P)-binding protein n=1 Tax=Devosia sediminis TaxID=2798801 RepID=A0A934IX02_9HYPH|nr:NmrA family NAD(P)-binding protein [Devosia sediminis]MBJ3784318.1 NmrA family NAD(P)-binding protein [Devosia sediminis]